MTTPAVSVEDVERTGRDTTVAQWVVAAVVMVGSMAAGGYSFHHLGEPWGLGVVTAVAVDVALAAWLLISRRLRAVGVTTISGWALELATMGMTLFLNVGAAAFRGVDPATAKALLGVAHSFLPIVLVLVSLAGGEAQLKLLGLRREREAIERAEQEAQLVEQRAAYDADQQRRAAERQREAERAEQDRAERIRAAELAAAAHEREVASRREARAARHQQAVTSLASVLALGAAWRSRPRPRPRTAATRPRSAAARTTASDRATTSAPDLAVLARYARPILDREPELGRRELAKRLSRELRVDVAPYWAQKAKDEIDRGRPLRAVRSDR